VISANLTVPEVLLLRELAELLPADVRLIESPGTLEVRTRGPRAYALVIDQLMTHRKNVCALEAALAASTLPETKEGPHAA
jgi:hypothetical protein